MDTTHNAAIQWKSWMIIKIPRCAMDLLSRSDWRGSFYVMTRVEMGGGTNLMEPPSGVEPLTCRLRIGCSTNWATVATWWLHDAFFWPLCLFNILILFNILMFLLRLWISCSTPELRRQYLFLILPLSISELVQLLASIQYPVKNCIEVLRVKSFSGPFL